MEVSNLIYMAPNMTALRKMTIMNIHFALLLIECFHLENETLVNGVQNVRQNVINRGVLIGFVGNPLVYQAPEINCFIAARAVSAHKVLFIV